MIKNSKNPKKPVKAGNRAPPRTIIISEDAKMKGKITERRENVGALVVLITLGISIWVLAPIVFNSANDSLNNFKDWWKR